MKKILFAVVFFFLYYSASAQPITDSNTLRSYQNAVIVPNGTKQITAAMLNRILNGHLNIVPTYSIDSLKLSNDSLFRRKNLQWKFVARVTPSGTSWDLNGNNSTTPGTNFFGTIDNKRVDIRTNNKIGQRFDEAQFFQTSKIRSLETVGEPDYEIIVVPDLQHMTCCYYAAGRSIFDTIAANKTAWNVKAVIGVGDMTEEANTAAEWDTLNAWYAKLDAVGIPYVTPPGNHDYNNRFTMFSTGRDVTSYNTHFGAARYSSKPHFVSAFHDRYENSMYKIDVGSRKYAIFSLEFHPTDSALNWIGAKCDSLLIADPDRQVIITTHAYIRAQGERAKDSDPSSVNAYSAGAGGVGFDNSGVEQWEKLYKKKANIRYVFSGHYIFNGVAPLIGFTHRITSAGENGNIVEQIYIDYQDDDNGGNGYFLRLKFRPDSSDVQASYYSSYLNQNDPLYATFTIEDPAIQVKSSLGVKGDAEVYGQFRATGKVKFDLGHRGRIPYFNYDGEIIHSSKLRFPTSSSPVDDSTGHLLLNDPTYDAAWNFNVNGTGKFSAELLGYPVTSSNIGRPTGLTSGLPATAYIVHGGSNYGLNITRASADAGGPSLSFYKTNSASPTTKVGANVLDIQGQVLFHSIGSDNSTVQIGERWEALVQSVHSTFVTNYTRIRGLNTSGVTVTKFLIDNEGRTTISNDLLSVQEPSAQLELRSTNKGFLKPRMTAAQRLAIASPAVGLQVYDTDSLRTMEWNGFVWVGYKFTTEGGGAGDGIGDNFADADLTLTGDRVHDGDGNELTLTNFDAITMLATDLIFDANSGDCHIQMNSGGALAITSTNNIGLNTPLLKINDASLAGASNGYVWTLADDITGEGEWAPAAGGGLADADYGDVTVSSSGSVITIDNDVVTYGKMQNVSATSRILGRITAGAGDVEELTAANVVTIINSSLDHGALAGLTDDDHPQYPLSIGRAGGQTIIGGTAATDDLILQSTGGVGTAGANIVFKVGNNGGTTAGTIDNTGFWNFPDQSYAVYGANSQLKGGSGYGIRFGSDRLALYSLSASGYEEFAWAGTFQGMGNNGHLAWCDAEQGAFAAGASVGIKWQSSGNLRVSDGSTGYGGLTLKKLITTGGTASAGTAPIQITAGTINTTAEAGAVEYNGTHYLTKASGLRYATEGTIADFYTDVNNSGTSETDIYSYTTPASTLGADGEKVFFTYTINLTDITSTAAIKVYFAGTAIASTGALTVSATGAVIVQGWLVRTSSTTVRATVNISSPTASTAVYTAQTDLTSLTLSGTNILKITGQAGGAGGGSNDIVGKSGTVSWRGAAAN